MKDIRSKFSVPTVSLSGVSNKNYVNAIEGHVEAVFRNDRTGKDRTGKAAFPDEVDTVTEGGSTAFRYLMDPMTGTVTDDQGQEIDKGNNEKAEKLYWFFAGSASDTREGFIEKLSAKDEKVRDFFDRIHSFISLPGASQPGEAMLQALVTIMGLRPDVVEIEIRVLLVFGAIDWRSSRQLKTVSQMVAEKVKSGETVLVC